MGQWELSILTSWYFCKFKTVLRNKVYLKKKRRDKEDLMCIYTASPPTSVQRRDLETRSKSGVLLELKLLFWNTLSQEKKPGFPGEIAVIPALGQEMYKIRVQHLDIPLRRKLLKFTRVMSKGLGVNLDDSISQKWTIWAPIMKGSELRPIRRA